MLLRLSADGSEIMVMENLTENGVVKIFDENSRMHLSPQTAYTYPAKGINHTFMCGGKLLSIFTLSRCEN